MDSRELADACRSFRGGEVRLRTYRKVRRDSTVLVFLAGTVSTADPVRRLTAEGACNFVIAGDTIDLGVPGTTERFRIWDGPKSITNATVVALSNQSGGRGDEPPLSDEERLYRAFDPLRFIFRDALLARLATGRVPTD